MIEMRRAQRSFGDGLIAEEVSDLREGWMELGLPRFRGEVSSWDEGI